MLHISNLKTSVEGKTILNGVNIDVKKNETHVILGKNGSGKTSLVNSIIGNNLYKIDAGEMLFEEKDIKGLSIEDRALGGIFLAFQNPIEIEGLGLVQFIKEGVNAKRAFNNLPPIKPLDLIKQLKTNAAKLQMEDDFLKRDLNVGFSGGEKKRCEFLQLLMLEPKLVILDELDSGVDISSLKVIESAITELQKNGVSFIIITHNLNFAKKLNPSFVHVLKDGKIVETGKNETILKIENEGF